MLSYYVIYYEKFRKVMKRIENVALTIMYVPVTLPTCLSHILTYIILLITYRHTSGCIYCFKLFMYFTHLGDILLHTTCVIGKGTCPCLYQRSASVT